MSSRSSSRDPSGPLPERVEVARVGRPHGVRGEVVVEILSDVPGRLGPGEDLELVTPAGVRRPVRIVSIRPQGRRAVIRLEGCADREAAAGLRDARLEIPRQRVPDPPADTYYHFELLDCVCSDRRAGPLGRVVELIEDGGGLLLKVAEGEREHLIPFVDRFIVKIDIARGTIELDLPDGLLD